MSKNYCLGLFYVGESVMTGPRDDWQLKQGGRGARLELEQVIEIEQEYE